MIMRSKFLRMLVFASAFAFMTVTAFASVVINTTVKETIVANSGTGDPEHIEKEEPNHRMPSRLIDCSLDMTSGVQFIGVETPDFVLYEIYDSNNACVGVYGDESEFLTALFSLTGEYRINLSTAEVSYIGYVIL